MKARDAARKRKRKEGGETNLVESIQASGHQRHPVTYQSPFVLLLSSRGRRRSSPGNDGHAHHSQRDRAQLSSLPRMSRREEEDGEDVGEKGGGVVDGGNGCHS